MDVKQVFSRNLNYYMEKNGKTQSDLVNELGLNKSTVSTWSKGIKMPRMGTIQTLADYFGIMKSDLIEDKALYNESIETLDDIIDRFDNLHHIKLKKFPMLGQIACGEPIYAEQDYESFVMAAADIKADFVLEAKGDSMIGARIQDGDIVFIKEQPIVENGEIAAVIIEDETTLKRVYYTPSEGKLILSPENSKYSPLVYVGEELNHIRILGKAVFFQSLVH